MGSDLDKVRAWDEQWLDWKGVKGRVWVKPYHTADGDIVAGYWRDAVGPYELEDDDVAWRHEVNPLWLEAMAGRPTNVLPVGKLPEPYKSEWRAYKDEEGEEHDAQDATHVVIGTLPFGDVRRIMETEMSNFGNKRSFDQWAEQWDRGEPGVYDGERRPLMLGRDDFYLLRDGYHRLWDLANEHPPDDYEVKVMYPAQPGDVSDTGTKGRVWVEPYARDYTRVRGYWMETDGSPLVDPDARVWMSNDPVIEKMLIDRLGPEAVQDSGWWDTHDIDGVPPHVFRVMSEEDFQKSMQQGYHQSDERFTYLGQAAREPEYWKPEDSHPEGTVAGYWTELGYISNSPNGVGRVVKIRTDPEDGWQEHSEPDYLQTFKPIPTSRFVAWSDRIKSAWGQQSPPTPEQQEWMRQRLAQGAKGRVWVDPYLQSDGPVQGHWRHFEGVRTKILSTYREAAEAMAAANVRRMRRSYAEKLPAFKEWLPIPRGDYYSPNANGVSDTFDFDGFNVFKAAEESGGGYLIGSFLSFPDNNIRVRDASGIEAAVAEMISRLGEDQTRTWRKNLRGIIQGKADEHGKRAYPAMAKAVRENDESPAYASLRDRMGVEDNVILINEKGYGKPFSGISDVLTTASRDIGRTDFTMVNALAISVNNKMDQNELTASAGYRERWLKPGAAHATMRSDAALLRHEWGHGAWAVLSERQREGFKALLPHKYDEVDWDAIASGMTEYAAGTEESRASYNKTTDSLAHLRGGYFTETFAEAVALTTGTDYDPELWPDWVNDLRKYIGTLHRETP